MQACRGDKFDPGTLLSIKKWRNSDTDDQWVNSKLWAGLLPWNGGSSNGSMICGLPEIAASWWDLLGRGLADSSALHMPRFTTTVDASEEYVIPNCADIIIANSTIEGICSYF